MKASACVVSTCTCLALICGLGMIGIGGFVLANMYAYLDLVDSTVLYATVGVMVLGAVVAFINFFGCYGSCTKSKGMLTTFLVLKALVLVAEVAVVVLALVYKDKITTFASKAMRDGLQNYNQDGYQSITNVYNMVQHDLHCCGVNGYEDWAKTSFGQGKNVPDSCCETYQYEGCGANALVTDDSPVYQDGCLSKFTGFVTDNGVYIIGGAIILIILEILTAVLGCIVCSRTKESLTV